MPRKKVFSKVKAVKDMARTYVGTPPAGRVIPDAKTKAERRAQKHKLTLSTMLQEKQ